MALLILAPLHDSEGKKDVSGAFLPEARALSRARQGVLRQIDNRLPLGQRRSQSMLEINKCVLQYREIKAFAAFCHGWQNGIQIGFKIQDVSLLARALTQQRTARSEPFVAALYCCDTGRDADADREDDLAAGPGGVGGFADSLCEAIGSLGFRARVTAHVTLGHTTSNPYVRVFDSADTVNGGLWLIEPKSAHWLRWARLLRDTDLRFRIPFMTRDQVLAEVATPGQA